MTMTAFCAIILTLSVLSIIISFALSLVMRKRKLDEDNAFKRQSIFNSFHVFFIGFAIAVFLIFYPVFYSSYLPQEARFIRFFKTVLLSLYSTLQTFFMNSSFDGFKDFIGKPDIVNYNLGVVYTSYVAVLFAVAPFLTFGIILSFFKDSMALIKYALYPAKEIYLFSELNEMSLSLARDIIKQRGKARKLLVFTDVFEKDEEKIFELVSRAKCMGAICLKKDVTELGLKYSKRKVLRKIYLIGKNEDDNLSQALTLIRRCRDVARYNTLDTQFFVFANSEQSEVLLNTVDNGAMKVRRITEYRNLILNTLCNNSIFENAYDNGKEKEVNVVIVGMGSYGTELLKTLCWLGQIPGYKVTIHAFDKGKAEEKFKCIAPELLKYSGQKIDGEPYYNIVFKDDTDVYGSAFLDKLSKIENVTAVYVAMGDDEMNIETAMRLRTHFGRESLKPEKNMKVPEIYAIVYSKQKAMIFNKTGGLKSIEYKRDGKYVIEDYGIKFIGDIGSRYTLDIIEQDSLETEGFNTHIRWSKTDAERAKNMALYEKYEYYRKSSIATSVHRKILEELLKKGGLTDGNGNVPEDILDEYEHKRWNAFMRAEGYINDDVRDDIAKTHHDLKPYGKLDKNERDKDKIVRGNKTEIIDERN